MKKRVVAMVLVGGRGTRLGAITKHTAKPAVTFGGKYKLIDFVLSNLSHAFIDTIGVITQYEPHALMNYIQHGSSWDLDVSDGGIHFLTPYTTRDGDQWQKGTAHAIKQHLHFIDAYDPDHILILAGDHVYKMDYNALIDHHQKHNADLTIGAFKPHDALSRYGVFSIHDNVISGFEEKPENPKGEYASMGLYVFKTDVLKTILENIDTTDYDFGKNVIPKVLTRDYKVCPYIFDGYFRDVGTVKSLYDANMDLLDRPELLKLYDYKTNPLYTKSEDLPPHHNISSDDVRNSLVSDGVLIMGRIDHSIISSRVLIKAGAYVKDSLIYSNVKIGENAHLEKCIVLENTVILPQTKLVFDKPTVIDNESLWELGGDHNE
ncbi:MAG: glucose-1-phosphate adenylyltransferase family protein [Bacillota bacterium]